MKQWEKLAEVLSFINCDLFVENKFFLFSGDDFRFERSSLYPESSVLA